MSSETEHRRAASRVPLIVGLGNPILSDDRVGLEVARALFARLPPGAAELREASVGGIELLPLLEGRRRVLLVDAVEPGRLAPGEVVEIAPVELERRYPPMSPHNAGFAHCVAFARACGLEMPDDVRIFGIGVRDPYTLGERCSPEVERAVPRIAALLEERLFGPQGSWADAIEVGVGGEDPEGSAGTT